MLLLQRRIGESIYIGDDIKITVLEATGRQVRLGIQAPRDIAVHREEIYHRIQREGNQAQTGSGGSQEDNQYTPRRQNSSAPQMRYRSANPYRKNSPSYRNQDNYDNSSNVSHHPFSNNQQDDDED